MMECPHLREGLLLGIGNPLLDVSANVDNKVLEKYNLKPDNAILAEEIHKPLCSELIDDYNAELIAGGSVQNSLRVFQWILGKPRVATFFGGVGEDKYSKQLEKSAQQAGVNVQYQYIASEPTGTCAVLITGKNRSLCANLGAANSFTIDHLQKSENKALIENAQFYYISGFFLTVSPPSALEIAKYALSHDRLFIMNLSAPFVSILYKDALMELMPYVDILIGNEDEAVTYAREQNLCTEDPKEIALKICQLPKQNENRPRICVITTGHNPVIFACDGQIMEYAVTIIDKEMLVDTNGAGDAFTGGFLAQLICGHPYDVCIKCGIWAATQIIQRSGCTFEGKANFSL